MTMGYDHTDLKILLNKAIMNGDKDAEAAIKQALSDEYDEIMQAQDLMNEIKP